MQLQLKIHYTNSCNAAVTFGRYNIYPVLFKGLKKDGKYHWQMLKIIHSHQYLHLLNKENEKPVKAR